MIFNPSRTKHVIGILITTVISILIAMAFVGCNAEKKATQKVDKLTDRFPATLDIIRQKHPCDENNADSVDFADKKRIADSLLEELATRDKILDRTSEAFQALRKHIIDSIWVNGVEGLNDDDLANWNCDSVVNGISDYATELKMKTDRQKMIIDQLRSVINNFQPIKVTDPLQVDSVRRIETKERDAKEKALTKVAGTEKDRDEWRSLARQRFWMIVALCSIIAMIIGYNIYRVKKKTVLNGINAATK